MSTIATNSLAAAAALKPAGARHLRVLPSVCPLDCPDTCALHLTLDGDRLVKLVGNAQHPITQGFACVKMAKYPQRQEHPDRLLVPQRRVGKKGEGRFVPIGWTEAIEEIADRLKGVISKYGEQSVLPYSYAGTMGLVERDHPLAFFRALGASELDWTICATTGSAGWEANYGPQKLATPPEEIVHSRLIVLWGINVLRSNSHLVPWLKEARHRGAKILHIDPYRNETSRFADEHWQIKVGTDTALALALGRETMRLGLEDQNYLSQHADDLNDYRSVCEEWPIERAAEFCGLDADRVKAIAQQIGAEKRTFFKVGYGMTRNEGGGNAMRAITLLPALTGAWLHQGGGASLSTSGAFGLNTSKYSGMHLLKPERRHVNQNQLGQALNDTQQPIQALFVFNSNPMAVAPDSAAIRRGASREDLLTVVIEHFQTDTADFADWLLPATTFLEHPDIYTAYGHYHLQWAEPVISPRGECRPNSWIFQQLSQRMGLDDPVLSWSPEEIARHLLSSDHPHLAGITFERLVRERSIRVSLPNDFRPYATGSNFPDRKIRFSPAPRQVDFRVKPTSEFPLRLISPPGSHWVNTSLGNIQELMDAMGGEPTLLLHPTDAARLGILDQTKVRVSSPVGSIVRKVVLSQDTQPGVIISVGLWWPKLAPDRRGLNELTSQELTDLGGGSLFGNQVVRIEPVLI